MHYIELSNGVKIPQQMMGTSVWDYKGRSSDLHARMAKSICFCLNNRIAGLDTARDYWNEEMLGSIFKKLFSSGNARREDLFITTKVGNSQQRLKNMYREIDISLSKLKLEYVDLWLLHWPLPDYWLENWEQMIEIYKSGKVKAIGIANIRERHIEDMIKSDLKMPHVVQIEHHPFRTIPGLLDKCKSNGIQVEAYSSNCLMLPFVRNNETLKMISQNHHKSIAQIITRWHIQHGVVPIFSSFNTNHIKENVDVYDFSLSKDEMQQIFSLDLDYKFHPESLNCPGF